MADYVKITTDSLDVAQINDLVTESCTGATSMFVGTTRDHFKGKKVLKLEYEAYEPMALKKLNQLCCKVRQKWTGVHHIAVHHRLGEVGPKEASVIIAVTSAHRQDSLEAVHYAIDELKATVPIWKKELYDDGSEWKENKECPWASQDVASPPKVDPKLVQITAGQDELDRRIEAFIARKRIEIDASNIREFCDRTVPTKAEEETEDFSTCARTDAVVVKRSGSKSHLRKSHVVNEVGPSDESGTHTPDGIKERLNNLEDIVYGTTVKPVPKDVYARLKALEERVLHLESVSPEYFATGDKSVVKAVESIQEAKLHKDTLSASLAEINYKIEDLRNTIKSKVVRSEPMDT